MILKQWGERVHTPRSGRVDKVVQEYAAALGIPFHAYAPASHLSPPRWGGGLHLHVYALPARPHWLSLRPVTPSIEISAAFSWTLAAGTNRALAPGNLFSQGVLKYDHKGHALTGILGENIYVLFDLLGQPEELVPLILGKTLDLSLAGMLEWLSPRIGRLPHQVELTLHRLRHATTLATLDHPIVCADDPGYQDPQYRATPTVEEGGILQEQMAVVEAHLKELSRQLASQTRLLQNCQERLRILKRSETAEEQLLRELDGLLGIPEVRGVEVLEDRLRVFTDTVDTIVAGKRYRLGRFCLDIRFNGEVAIKNVTHAYGYYDHPHVWNAKPCLGNIGQSILKLVSEFQWVAAAVLLLEYLKTVNPKEWYTPIDHWEEVRA